uniref:PHF5-like protein n=1 Tax=Quercus lobata TaxID=97700 RepID=A0A7N2LD10_QUELO
MAKHHPDLIMCRKQPGIAIGRLCEKCDGKCVICDSYVRPCTLVRVCDECNYGSFQGRCVICGGVGISDAYYCKECTQQEKDRDGCPKIVNLGSAKTDLFYEHSRSEWLSYRKSSFYLRDLMSSILGAVAVCGLGVSENAEGCWVKSRGVDGLWVVALAICMGRWVMGGGTGNMHGLLGFAAL